jgi:hypothetical protein
MKRVLIGAILAAIAWMIATQTGIWAAEFVGPIFGFIAGLCAGDWEATKHFAAKSWERTMTYETDWKGTVWYLLSIVVALLSMALWIGAYRLCNWGSQYLFTFAPVFSTEAWEWIDIFVQLGVAASLVVTIFVMVVGWCDDADEGQVGYCKEALSYVLFYTNPVAVAFWCLRGIVKLPRIISAVSKGVCVLGAFLGCLILFLLCLLLKLVAHNKSLTFATCVTAGTLLGMLAGKTWICCGIAAATSGTLVLVSDLTSEWAENRLQTMKADA